MSTKRYIAEHCAKELGTCLIGKKILTQRMGEYPGGWATVTALWPDKNAPEIALTVNHPTFGEIGIYSEELIEIDQ